ncbi:hypothetical protein DFJ73DRAFT_763016 [Zopfochytrium polystomum]|nr:hypothetical protein DFJ73DRAFT_763016 [Zopfochytrium polystomum]
MSAAPLSPFTETERYALSPTPQKKNRNAKQRAMQVVSLLVAILLAAFTSPRRGGSGRCRTFKVPQRLRRMPQAAGKGRKNRRRLVLGGGSPLKGGLFRWRSPLRSAPGKGGLGNSGAPSAQRSSCSRPADPYREGPASGLKRSQELNQSKRSETEPPQPGIYETRSVRSLRSFPAFYTCWSSGKAQDSAPADKKLGTVDKHTPCSSGTSRSTEREGGGEGGGRCERGKGGVKEGLASIHDYNTASTPSAKTGDSFGSLHSAMLTQCTHPPKKYG